jgi:hypothetical protein
MKYKSLKEVEKDPRVSFVVKGHNKGGVWIYLNSDYYYQPEMNTTHWGISGATFIHKPTEQEALEAMDDVIHQP